jgi:hypothetical protein
MPVYEKAAKQEVTFALAVVKSSVLADRAESSKIEAALRIMFPGASFILVAEEAEDEGLGRYRSRQNLSGFITAASCGVMPFLQNYQQLTPRVASG